MKFAKSQQNKFHYMRLIYILINDYLSYACVNSYVRGYSLFIYNRMLIWEA